MFIFKSHSKGTKDSNQTEKLKTPNNSNQTSTNKTINLSSNMSDEEIERLHEKYYDIGLTIFIGMVIIYIIIILLVTQVIFNLIDFFK